MPDSSPYPKTSISDRTLGIIGLVWAFFESSLFFILPDFYILPAAISRPHLWKRLVLYSVLGSFLGTALFIVAISFIDPAVVKGILLHTPFVTESMFMEVSQKMGQNLFAGLTQSISQIPLKVWTWSAVTSGHSLGIFMLTAFISRTIRICIVGYCANWIGTHTHALRRRYWAWCLVGYTLLFLSLLWIQVYG